MHTATQEPMEYERSIAWLNESSIKNFHLPKVPYTPCSGSELPSSSSGVCDSIVTAQALRLLSINVPVSAFANSYKDEQKYNKGSYLSILVIAF